MKHKKTHTRENETENELTLERYLKEEKKCAHLFIGLTEKKQQKSLFAFSIWLCLVLFTCHAERENDTHKHSLMAM